MRYFRTNKDGARVYSLSSSKEWKLQIEVHGWNSTGLLVMTNHASGLQQTVMLSADDAGNITELLDGEATQRCESCYEDIPLQVVEYCPACNGTTCENCRCLDEHGTFAVCERCAA